MLNNMLKVGNGCYINPLQITTILPTGNPESGSYIHLTDNRCIETESQYTPDAIVEQLQKINYLA